MDDFSWPSPTLQSPSPASTLLALRLHRGFVQNETVKVPSPQAHYTAHRELLCTLGYHTALDRQAAGGSFPGSAGV